MTRLRRPDTDPAPGRRGAGRARGIAGVPTLGLAALALLGACDVPTELPRWTTDWDVTLVSDTLDLERLLPTSVRPVAGGFAMDSVSESSRVRLGDVCEVCTCFSGPLPPVEITPTDWPVPLPAGVVDARLSEGTARLTLHNELSFDLLDDGEGARGFLVVELVDPRTDDVVLTRRISRPLPPGDSASLAFPLEGVVLHQNLAARVRGRTPGTGCDSVSLDPDAGLRAEVTVRDLRSRTVRIVLSDQALALESRELELPRELARRLRPGDARAVLEVDVENGTRTSAEVTLSAAPRPELLFGADASLLTPLPLPAGSPEEPGRVRKRYLLDLTGVPDADRFHVRGRTRITGSRLVTYRGPERIVYTLRLRLRLPGR